MENKEFENQEWQPKITSTEFLEAEALILKAREKHCDMCPSLATHSFEDPASGDTIYSCNDCINDDDDEFKHNKKDILLFYLMAGTMSIFTVFCMFSLVILGYFIITFDYVG